MVKGEVKGCDVAAVRGDELWIVELKLSFNITLVFQAMERQKLSENVFVALPRPRRAHNKNFLAAQKLLRKLEIGLIAVALESPVKQAEIIIFPGGRQKKISMRAAAVKKEIEGRSSDSKGGVTKTKINTAFRERCIRVACALEIEGRSNAPDLVAKYSCAKDTYNIFYRNYYGWFE
ncbi:MAG: DUF2161 family putative PD-(D/E)XK-type phosphodiesterase, partial [Defluviitaleaceae bacterium]|nr:DUF2161 family putative PD-(D/E)XK-type phosphodiesterase [Defluviitaleaceae bacterium]